MSAIWGFKGIPWRSLDVDETEDEVSDGPIVVYGGVFYNSNASARYLKFYNASAANVTVGTTTPVATIALKGQDTTYIPRMRFSVACSIAAVTGIADNDTTGAGTNEVSGMLTVSP